MILAAGALPLVGVRPTTYRLALALALVILLAPLAVGDLPPLGDFQDHVARGYLLAHLHDNPILARVYKTNWSIIPNLALDGLMLALQWVMPIYAAGRVVLAAALLSPVLGCIAYHRARFQVRSLWPLASIVVAYNGAFMLGFANFLIGAGMALLVAAAWIRWGEARGWRGAIVMSIGAVAVFFAHVYDYSFLVLLLGTRLAAALPSLLRRPECRWAEAAGRATAVVLVLLPPALLYLASPLHGAGGGLSWGDVDDRLRWAFGPFFTYHFSLDVAAALVLCVTLAASATTGSLVVAPDGLLCLGVAILFYGTTPAVLNGSGFFFVRFGIMAGFLIFAAVQPTFSMARASLMVVAAIAGLAVLRTAIIATTWSAAGADLAELRRVFSAIPPGSFVLVAATGQSDDPVRWQAMPAYRLSPAGRLYTHLPALMVIERSAIPQIIYTHPAKQPITVRKPFRPVLPYESAPLPTEFLRPGAVHSDTLRQYTFLANWRGNFDYVLVLCPLGKKWLTELDPGDLDLLVRTDIAALFRIRR